MPDLTLTLARRISQGLFLALFLFLFIQTESKGTDELGWPVKLFLDFDPLIFLTTALASHTVEGLFWLSLILVGLTVLLGRFFCGWVCPLGTLNNLAGSLRKKRPKPPGPGWFRLKYYILVAVLALSLFGVQLAGVLDPISLTIRSFSLAIYPALSYAATSLFDGIYRLNLPLVTPASEAVYDVSEKNAPALPAALVCAGDLHRTSLSDHPGAQPRAAAFLVPVYLPAGGAAGAAVAPFDPAPERERRV